MPTLRNKKTRQVLRESLFEKVDHGLVTPAEAVRSFRKILGLSQIEFAKKQGVALLALRQIETEIGNPTLSTLAKLLKGSGLEVKVGRSQI